MESKGFSNNYSIPLMNYGMTTEERETLAPEEMEEAPKKFEDEKSYGEHDAIKWLVLFGIILSLAFLR